MIFEPFCHESNSTVSIPTIHRLIHRKTLANYYIVFAEYQALYTKLLILPKSYKVDGINIFLLQMRK